MTSRVSTRLATIAVASACLLLIGSSTPARAQGAGPVAAYALSEATGTSTVDSSGNGNPGTLMNGTAWTTSGRYGSGLVFDGDDDKVEVAGASALDLTTAFTFEGWVYPTTSNLTWNILQRNGTGGIAYSLQLTNNTRKPYVYFTTSAGTYSLVSDTGAPSDAWTHVAVTWDGTTVRFYQNGVLSDEREATGTIIATTTSHPLTIGHNPGQGFAGRLDEVRIYSRALSATDVALDRDLAIDQTAAPEVAQLTPAESAHGVAPTTVVTVTFTKAVNPTTLTGATFYLTGPAGAVPGAITYNSTTHVATLTPTNELARLTDYTAHVTTGVADLDEGNLPAAVTWTFQTSPDPALVHAAFSFSEGTGATTADNSGNGNTGALTNGPAWTIAGRHGDALVFDGDDDKVEVVGSTSLDLTTAFTLEGWVYPTASNLTWSVIRRDGIGNLAYALQLTGGSRYPYVYFTTSTGTHSLVNYTSVPLNAWTHVAATWDGTTVTFYQNGVALDTYEVSGTLISSASSQPLAIGWGPGQGFAGKIDEVRVYGRALSASEIGLDRDFAVNQSAPPGVAQFSPATSLTGIAPSTVVTATFTKAIDSSTLTSSTFYLAGPSGNVTGTIAYDAPTHTASFTPSSALGTLTSYTIHITTGVTDLGSAALATPLTSAFLTSPDPALPHATFSFSEGAGATTADNSGNGNTGALINGPAWTPAGRHGGALVFDGDDDKVEAPGGPSLDLTTGFTLEGWVYPTASNLTWSVIRRAGIGNMAYTLQLTGGSRYPYVYFTTSTGPHSLINYTAVPLNAWTHVAATWDGTTVRFYQNGVALDTYGVTGTLIPSASFQPLDVGWGPGQAFAGRLDDVRIYSRALSESEVATDMDAPAEGEPPQTVAPPEFSSSGGDYSEPVGVAITTSTSSATIHYTTDGTDPTESSPAVSGVVTIGQSGTLRAKAWRTGYDASTITSATYTLHVVAPSVSPAGGSYGGPVTITMSTSTTDATIRYTTDGSAPGESSPAYTGAFTLGLSGTVKARAFVTGWTASGVTDRSYELPVDSTPPTITATVSPEPNANGWNNTPVIVSFTCADASGIASCSTPVSLAQDGSEWLVSGTAVDTAQNETTISVTVNIDKAPGTVTVTSPGSGTSTDESTIGLTGTVSDALSGVANARCNGVPATVVGGTVDCTVTLGPGMNSIVLSIMDAAGNSASAGVRVAQSGTATQLSIVPNALTLIVGQSRQLQAISTYGVIASGADWESGNASVSVSADGLVTAEAVGQTTVTGTFLGVTASTVISVIEANSLETGTPSWTAPPIEGMSALPPIYTARVDADGPDLFAVDTASDSGPYVVRALRSDGTMLFTENAPGKPVMGDVFGGVVAMLPNYSGLARFAGPTTAKPWWYESEGSIGAPAQAPDGTIFFSEIVTRTDDYWNTYVVGLNGNTGTMKFRIQLPTSTQVGGCGHYNLHLDNLPGPIAIGNDGAAYLQASDTHETWNVDCRPEDDSTYDGGAYFGVFWGNGTFFRSNRVQLMRVTSGGGATYQTLFQASEGGVDTKDAFFSGHLGGFGTVVPDGLGGVLASWTSSHYLNQPVEGQYGIGPVTVDFASHVTRSAGGGMTDHEEAIDPVYGYPDSIELTGEAGIVVTKNLMTGVVKARNAITWETKWTDANNPIPFAALPDGGVALQGWDGSLYQREPDGQVASLSASAVWFPSRSQAAFGLWTGISNLGLAAVFGPALDEALSSYQGNGGSKLGNGAQPVLYKDLDTAALAALDYVYPFAVGKNVEYGGVICQSGPTDAKRYSWSRIVFGDAGYTNVFSASCRAPDITVGAYHTHVPSGENQPSGPASAFASPNDINSADTHPGVMFYLKAKKLNNAAITHHMKYWRTEVPYTLVNGTIVPYTSAYYNTFERVSNQWQHYVYPQQQP